VHVSPEQTQFTATFTQLHITGQLAVLSTNNAPTGLRYVQCTDSVIIPSGLQSPAYWELHVLYTMSRLFLSCRSWCDVDSVEVDYTAGHLHKADVLILLL